MARYWRVLITTSYEIEAEDKQEAMKKAKKEFLEDDCPEYDVSIDYSWDDIEK